MRLREDILQFPPQVSGVGGAIAVGADGDLQITPLDNSGGVEIALLGLINDIAEDFQLLTIMKDLLIECPVMGGGEDQGGPDKIIFSVDRQNKLDIGQGQGLFTVGGNMSSDDRNPGSGRVQGLNLVNRNGSRSDHYRTASCHFKIDRKLSHTLILPQNLSKNN